MDQWLLRRLKIAQDNLSLGSAMFPLSRTTKSDHSATYMGPSLGLGFLRKLQWIGVASDVELGEIK